MATNLAEFQATRDMIDKSYIPMRRNAEDVQAERQIQEDEYDPFADRPSVSLTSDFAVFMHLLKSAIGTGILFLPHAFRRTGYAMSIVCGIVMGTLFIHMAIIVVQCSQALCRRNRVPMLDFAETAQFSFQAGPERIRKYARLFGVVTNVIICFVHFQAAVIYILYVATSFQQVTTSTHTLATPLLRIYQWRRPLLAIAVPQMVPLLGLFSALGMSTIMLLIPILIETSTKWAEATRTMFAKNIAIFIVWLLILVFGAIESTWSIVREYNRTKQEEC